MHMGTGPFDWGVEVMEQVSLQIVFSLRYILVGPHLMMRCDFVISKGAHVKEVNTSRLESNPFHQSICDRYEG